MIRSPRSIADYDLLFDPIGGLEQKRVTNRQVIPPKAARSDFESGWKPTSTNALLLGTTH